MISNSAKYIKLPDFLNVISSNSSGKNDLLSSIAAYQKFLYLAKVHPDVFLVPTKEIDEVWHHHIEQKKIYLNDCLNYFGYEIKHTQFQGEKYEAILQNGYKLTNELWYRYFNVAMGNKNQMALCGVGDDASDAPIENS